MPKQRPTGMTSANSFRIGLSPCAFGFGPASKVAAVARSLSKLVPVQFEVLAKSVALEHLLQEGFKESASLDPTSPDDRPEIERRIRSLNMAIVGLDPDWVSVYTGHVPVAYIDSLGFMWNKSMFHRIPALCNLDAYFVQDVFDSVERLRSYGVVNLFPVGAIVDERLLDKPIRAELGGTPVVHLGGVINPHGQKEQINYCVQVGSLLAKLIESHDYVLALTSESAISLISGRFPFRLESLPNDEAHRRLTSASYVFSATSLTVLLELTISGTPLIPLPPQNASQALILQKLCDRVVGLPRLFHYLQSCYRVERDEDETVGVAAVQAANQRLLTNATFSATYRKLAAEAISERFRLPLDIAVGFSGSEQVARSIALLLKSQHGHSCC